MTINAKDVLELARETCIDEVTTILKRLSFEDFTAEEAVAFALFLRPIHDRVALEFARSKGSRPHLVGDIK